MVAGMGSKNRAYMKWCSEKERAVVRKEYVVEDGFAFVFVLFHF